MRDPEGIKSALKLVRVEYDYKVCIKIKFKYEYKLYNSYSTKYDSDCPFASNNYLKVDFFIYKMLIISN